MHGRLVSWTIERAVATGLADVAHGDVVDVDGAPALVTALLADTVELAPLAIRPPGPGVVRRRGALRVDDAGRIADDGELVFTRDPVVVARSTRRMTLGTLVYDLQHVYGMGVALLAHGRREVLHHLLRHQVAMGHAVVIAHPGLNDPRVLVDVPCMHVVAPPDATPAMQWLVPWLAMAVASALRARGRDVVLAVDHLDAWRPHVMRCSARGSWPTQLAALASRAYALDTGSVSLIAMTRTVSPTRAAAFDSVLDLELALRGELRPMATKLVRPPIRVHSMAALGNAAMAVQQLVEHAPIAHAYGRIDSTTEQQLEHGRRVRDCLRFRIGGTVDTVEQLLCLLAVAVHGIDDTDAYLTALRRDHGDTLAAIRSAGRITEAQERELLTPSTVGRYLE